LGAVLSNDYLSLDAYAVGQTRGLTCLFSFFGAYFFFSFNGLAGVISRMGALESSSLPSGLLSVSASPLAGLGLVKISFDISF